MQDRRPWTFYVLATLMALFIVFLYGPMLSVLVLSFQGANGSLNFPLRNPSLIWFDELFNPTRVGDVPGEYYHPTQPIPRVTPALSRTGMNLADLVTAEDTTAEHAAACRKMWDEAGGYLNYGPFTPFFYHREGTPPRSTTARTRGGLVSRTRSSSLPSSRRMRSPAATSSASSG